MKSSVKIVTFIFLLIVSLSAQTPIEEGFVSGIWSHGGSPYQILGEITIPDDSTLIIDPGVVIEFQGHYALQVQGRLLAVGTETDSILFTVNDTSGFSDSDTSLGGWFGIRFIDTPVSNDSSKIVYCKLQYGKAVADFWHLNAGGAISAINFGKIFISNCLFTHNIAGGRESDGPSGGAVHLAWSDVTFVQTTFANNSAHNGGALQSHESSPVFIDCIFESNSAQQSGGVAIDGNSNSTFTNCQFLNNHSSGWGGGIRFGDNTKNTLDYVTLSGNTADWGGGIGATSCELTINGCSITDNYSSTLGGGLAADFSAVTIYNTTLDLNQAFTGGGIHSYNSDLEINLSLLKGNSSLGGTGGAINSNADSAFYHRPFRLIVLNTRFIENTADEICAGAYIDQSEPLSAFVDVYFDRCEFYDNHADRVSPLRIAGTISYFTISNTIFSGNTSTRWTGGAGFLSGCKGKVFNCVFSSNYSYVTDSSAVASGVGLGGIDTQIDFMNCTFSDNSGISGVGLSARNGATATLTNSIIWGCGDNPVSLTTVEDRSATIYINYCNLENGIDSIYVSDSLSTLHWGSGNIAEEPQFVDVQMSDFHLSDASPCIGSGVNCFTLNERLYCAPIVDIESNVRPTPEGSYSDMGAYENTLGDPSSLDVSKDLIPRRFSLGQNYPNPFNPNTTIGYELPITNDIELSVFNLLGQKVMTLVSGSRNAGYHQVEWDASGFTSGVYYYRLSADEGFVQTKKLLLLK